MSKVTVFRCDRKGCTAQVDELPDSWEVVSRIDPTDVIARRKYHYCEECTDFTPPDEPFDMSPDEIQEAIDAVSGNG